MFAYPFVSTTYEGLPNLKTRALSRRCEPDHFLAENEAMSQIAEYENRESENPYRSPASASASQSSRPAASPDLEPRLLALQAFVGPRAEYYFRKWAPRLLNPSDEVGMNWVAFFFPCFWICYRKMYRVAFIFFGAVLLQAMFKEVLFLCILKLPNAPRGTDLIINVLIGIIIGLYGNAWYLTHAERKIAEAHAQGFRDEQLLRVLADRGGTSLLSSFGLCFLFFIVAVVVFICLGIFLYLLGGTTAWPHGS